MQPYRYDDFVKQPELDHVVFWEELVAPYVAYGWHKANPKLVDYDALLNDLKNCPYGFPRGRVTRIRSVYVIYHGGDLKMAQKKIEAAFGLKGGAQWKLDEHETMIDMDRQLVASALRNASNVGRRGPEC